jgi:hypothetical protein
VLENVKPSMKIDLTNIPPEGKRLNLMLSAKRRRPYMEGDRIVGLE